MESDQPSPKTNRLLNQYVYHMESEIGRSGKTLHQILSHFLKLKTENPALAAQVEDLEIPGAECLSPEQVDHFCKTLCKLQAQRNKVSQSVGSLPDHPWVGIVHPDIKPEEYDSLLRTMRFVLIQLNKLWVEIQSVPLFLNAVDHASISEIERVFRWLLASPDWNDLIAQPKVIPALAQLETRKILLDFVRDVQSVRLLCERLKAKEDPQYLDPALVQTGLNLLTEALPLVRSYQGETLNLSQLELKIQALEAKFGQLELIQRYFSKLALQSQIPTVKNCSEARKVFFIAGLIKAIPPTILPFRLEKILDSGQLGRIESWKDQAKTLLDLRKKLEGRFNLKESVLPEDLRTLGKDLASAGALRTFNSAYKAAFKRYQNLLKSDADQSARSPRRKIKDSPAEMNQHLLEWASFIEQVKKFESQPELRTVFGSQFKGIDTEFNIASHANLWATQVRAELKPETDAFNRGLYQFLTEASESTLNAAYTFLADERGREINGLLNALEIPAEVEFASCSTQCKTELGDLKRLQGILVKLGFNNKELLGSIDEMKTMTEEVIFLCNRMESSTEIKQWLRTSYRGADTDLSVIDQSLVFVQFIESAEISESLKTTFISPYGPQRLKESKALVASAWSSLEALKECFQKLELSTQGQARSLASHAIPSLINRLQHALRQPALLQDWVDYIRIERDVRALGLTQLLNYYEKRSLYGWQMEDVFELAFLATLLKKAISPSLKEGKDRPMPSYSPSLTV